jgi:hypothetical protein
MNPRLFENVGIYLVQLFQAENREVITCLKIYGENEGLKKSSEEQKDY